MATLEELNAQAIELTQQKDALRQELLAIGEEHARINDEIAALERETSDALVIAELRSRNDAEAAIAAGRIAATMQDPERAAKFDLVSNEIANSLGA